MKKLIKMPSIEQFRTVVSVINNNYSYIGRDENDEPVYDHSLKKPVIRFKGTVKLHGTNAGVSFNETDGIWTQSKNGIITVDSDNAGFSLFALSNENVFAQLFTQIKEFTLLDMSKHTATIYGEWCGNGIQKGVGICNLSKSFFIFGVKITPHTETEEELRDNPAYWVDSSYLRAPDQSIFNIEDYPTYNIDIDFNNPQLSQNRLIELTLSVENECPVAKAFGFDNTIGEGLVFSAHFNGVRYIFKSKGEKHSTSKVKTLSSVDVEKLNTVSEFIQYSVTQNRFTQACSEVFMDDKPSIEKLGLLIKWVISDIIKEELDTLVKNGIEPKEVNKPISMKVREMFFSLINK